MEEFLDGRPLRSKYRPPKSKKKASTLVVWTKEIFKESKKVKRREKAENVCGILFSSRKSAKRWVDANPGLDCKMMEGEDGTWLVEFAKE